MSQVFTFGKNWQHFVKTYLNEDRLDEAKKSLDKFCKGIDFRGKTFMDIGCGSGLFSLAALKLGAKEVVSFDADQDAVRCCESLRESEGNPGNWKIMHGSILDQDFLSGLGQFDIVYSWGVLHHTGSLWQAIDNAAKLMATGGLFYIAIYNKADGLAIYPDGRFGPSDFWLIEKRIYSHLPWVLQNVIDYMVMSILVLMYLLTLKNPVAKIKGHNELRGMSWRIDIKDWLGGYPYEYASVAEIFAFLKPKGFVLENLKSNNGLLNNEFLFRKS